MAFSAQRMGSLDCRLEEIITPLNGPLDDQPLGVIMDLEREVRREEDIFGRGLGINEGLIKLL